MTVLPLLAHTDLAATFCWTPQGAITVRQLLLAAQALAADLPEGGFLLNLCQDRYRFSVGFIAGVLRQKVSLQPSSQSRETFRQLAGNYPGLLCLTDSDVDTAGLPCFSFPADLPVDADAAISIPQLPASQQVAILFTSGSTGQPQAQQKHWGQLYASCQAEAAQLGLLTTPHTLVGTVPVQHSYGFESTFLLALLAACPFWSGKPFYPQDIATALAAVPAPRLLVTTPFHLQALLAAEIDCPAIATVLSATAPLSAALASHAENCLQAPVLEIYGSTETGQLASRRTTAGATWQLLPEAFLAQTPEGTVAYGPYINGRILLSDIIECQSERQFVLHGRQADLVNIAGKRTSLAYLNHQLAAIPGVQDGVFFLPDEAADEATGQATGQGGITRLAAFVVAPGLSARQIQSALRERIDSLFLPRPLVLLEALPREATGKLLRSQLQALYAAARPVEGRT